MLSEAFFEAIDARFLTVLFSPYNIQFMLGMLAAYFFIKFPQKILNLIILGSTLFSGFLVFYYAMHSNTFINGLCFFSILLIMVSIEKFYPIYTSNFFLLLGRASYAIYLTHTCFIQLSMSTLKKIAPSMDAWLILLLTSAFALALGILYHLYIEKPLQKAFTKPSPQVVLSAPERGVL